MPDSSPTQPGTAPMPPGTQPPANEPAAVTAAFGLARLARRRLGSPVASHRAARVPFANALRRFPRVHRMVQGTADAFYAWSRRPTGRLALPGLLLLATVAATGLAGVFLVPATTKSRPAAVAGAAPATPTASAEPTSAAGLPAATALPTAAAGPTGGPPTALLRPADGLASWAQQISGRVGIPPTAMQAYGYAEIVVRQNTPGCQIAWTTLAAIGKVESGHGGANATLGPDGQASPPILGLPLDGKGGRQLIADTDNGELDGDGTYDRAMGPMQFIPATWKLYAVDADNDGVTDPNDIDDAALAAGNYLCAGGRDLSRTEDWWNAILSYNEVRPYAQSVYEAANDYGTRSRA